MAGRTANEAVNKPDETAIPYDLARQVTDTLTAHDRDRAQSIEMAEKARGSFREFLKMAWPIMEPSRKFIHGWHADAICDHLAAAHARQIKKLLITVPPGTAKPVWEGEFIQERTRGRIPLSEIRVGDLVLTHAGRYQRVREVFEQGELALVEVRTWKGRKVRCATDHPFLTPRGWVQAENLTDKDFVAAVHPLEPCGTETVSIEEARLLGYAIGDGSLKYAAKSITNEDPSVVEDVIHCARSVGLEAVIRKRCGSKTQAKIVSLIARGGRENKLRIKGYRGAVRRWVEKHGLEGKCSYDKFVPKLILSGSDDIVRNFLGAYWSCDGYICKKSKERSDTTIGCDTVSYELAVGIQHLLCRLGIQSRLRTKRATLRSKVQGETYVSYTVIMSTMADASKFADQIPILHSKKSRLHQFTRSAFDKVLNEDQVLEVVPVGRGNCRCLSVETDNSFTAGDLAVHNSLITSVAWPAWIWTKDPGFRSIFSSYDAGLSTRDSIRCRDLMQSIWYQETFAPSWKFSSVQNEKTYYTNTHKGFRISTSVGGKSTGWRASLIAVDDATNIKDEFSDAVMEEAIRWWENVMFNRLDDMSTGLKVIVMQRISDRDLAGHVLREGGYEHLCIPNEYEPDRSKVTSIGWRDPRTQRGELMCPALISRAVTEEIKTKPSRWAGQYQQNPHPEGSGILRPHRWNYWKPKGFDNLPPVRVRMPDGQIEKREAVEIPDDFDLILQAWDMSFKDLKDSDYVAGLVVAARGAGRYLLEAVHDRMDIVKSVDAVRKMSSTGWGSKAHLKLIEGKANGPAVMQTLKGEIGGMIEVEPQGPKVSRVRAASYEQSAGNWYIPHPDLVNWVGDPADPSGGGGFIQECTAFPNGAHDDFPDCWSMGANRIIAEKDGAVYKAREPDITMAAQELPKHWKRVYGLCVTWDEIAAVWMAQDPETKHCVLYSEYWAIPTDPAMHVKAIKERGDWIPGVISAVETGRDRRDGYMLAEKYVNLGLKIDATPEMGDTTAMVDVNNALNQGKLKIFGTLSKFFDQYRMYRRDPKGRLPLHNVAVMRALETVWQWGHERLRAQPGEVVKVKPIEVGRSVRDNGGGWMAG